MFLKKLIILLTIIITIFLSSSVNIFAQELQGGEHIEQYDVDITVQKSGIINIKETIFYDFDTLQRHGIYRDIPFTYEGKNARGENTQWKMSIKNFSVVDEKGKEYKYEKTNYGDTIRLKIGHPDRFITGVHIYVISYSIEGGILYFLDHDELYWDAIGGSWNIPIEKAKITVYSPDEIGESELIKRCFIGSYRSEDENCSIHGNGQNLIFESNRVLNPYEGMSVVVSYPKGIIAELMPQEIIPFQKTLIGKFFIAALAVLAFFWYIVYPVKVIYKWFIYGRDPYVGPDLPAFYDVPEGKSGRSMTPAETGALVDENVHFRDITASIIDLARRGYLTIVEEKKGSVLLKKNAQLKKSERLTLFEKVLYEKLFIKGEQVKIKDIHLAVFIQDINTKIYESLVSEDFFPKNPNSIRNFYIGMGILALMTFNVHLFIIAITFGRNMPRKTKKGSEEALKARGLRSFLKSQEMHFDYIAKQDIKRQLSPQFIFEKFLPFAVAFGVEKEWMKKFSDVMLAQPTWYQSTYGGHFTHLSMMSHMQSSFHSMNSVISTTVSSTGRSSGFSSGGGFSGGGGGGGGGGSW